MRLICALAVSAICGLTSCAFVHTQKADLNAAPVGIRVFPPKFYLAVDKEKGQSMIFYAPDTKNAYDVSPVTILAKHNFQLDIEEGQIKTIKSDQDTTGILDFVKSMVEAAGKSSGGAVSTKVIEATFGLASGLYALEPDGTFAQVVIAR